MPELDLIVRNARVVTASDEFGADIGSFARPRSKSATGPSPWLTRLVDRQ
jgi:hypothetical protein